MNKTRILIVDDDKSILRMLEYGLRKLGPDYQIYTAKDMFSAINQIEKRWFDLIFTDYMMPGMTGIDLARAVHRISPDTRIVLMTAYGTSKLRDTSMHIGFDGYLDKPFDIQKVRKIVQGAREQVKAVKKTKDVPMDEDTGKTEPVPVSKNALNLNTAKTSLSIENELRELQINAGAGGVILISSTGKPVSIAGQIDMKKATGIAALAASNFLQTTKLSSLLDNKKTFKSGFYEGDSYNIYLCDVSDKALLAVIFDVKLRPGVVWFYAKQTAATLVPLLG